MTEPFSPTTPAWIFKRDGRLVPFESDRISRALFAATESLGRPDAFLARELTDGVVHFLTAETESGVPTTAQVRELVVKVVRELGQPALAQAFADGPPRRATESPFDAAREASPDEVVFRFSVRDPLPAILHGCRSRYALQAVFARDLVAAQGDGLLTLTGLTAPFELAGCVLGPPESGQGLVETIEATRQLAGAFLVVDGPEHTLIQAEGAGQVPAYVRELAIGLRATRLRAIVNLNTSQPPSWADDLAEGPLFRAIHRPPEPHRLAGLRGELLEQLLRCGSGTSLVRLDWHLCARDFQSGCAERLDRLVRAALQGAPVAFVFDRPRRPLPLAEGIDRRHAAVLLTVGLHLARLAEQVPAGAVDLFVQKLGSLARLALSAAVQKRDFLRRHSQERPAVTRGFLLDRARLVVAPLGLDRAVTTLLGEGVELGGRGLELARQVLQRLRDVLAQDGASSRLQTCLDGSRLWSLNLEGEEGPGPVSDDIKGQLRLADALHAPQDAGTVKVTLSPENPPVPEQVVDWLRWTWQHTDLGRVRFACRAEAPRQLLVPWPEERALALGGT